MEKDIKIDGLNIHYSDTGNPEGDPVLLMHGWGCDHTTVISIASALERGMRVINVDLPGHGKSDEPKTVWGVEDFTFMIEKLIKELQLQDISLIGDSFGGRVAIWLGSRNKIKKIVLVDSAGVKPVRSWRYYFKIYKAKAFKTFVNTFWGKEKGGEIMERYRSTHGSADYRNATPMMRAVMSKCVNEDLCHLMPEIKAETLLLWGENDTATPMRDAKIMEKLIPGAGLVAFKDCGHYSFLDNPFGTKAVLQSFFKEQLIK